MLYMLSLEIKSQPMVSFNNSLSSINTVEEDHKSKMFISTGLKGDLVNVFFDWWTCYREESNAISLKMVVWEA